MTRSQALLATAFFATIALYAPLASFLGQTPALCIRYGLCALITLRFGANLSRPRKVPTVAPFVLMFCALAALSLGWSVSPSSTLLAAGDLAVTSLAAICIGTAFEPVDLVKVLVAAGSIMLVLSALKIGISPSSQRNMYGQLDLKGILGNSNEFARQLVCLAVLAGALSFCFRRYSFIAAAGLLTAASTGSVQVVVVAAAGFVALMGSRALLHSARARSAVATGILGLVSLSLYIAFSEREVFFSAFGKDSTLTHRVPIWEEAFELLNGRWITGFGYGAFWEVDLVRSKMATSSTSFAQQTHNGYIESISGIGLLGAFALVLILWRSLSISYRSLDTDGVGASALMATSTVLATYAISASIFARSPEQIYWVTILALSMSLATPSEAAFDHDTPQDQRACRRKDRRRGRPIAH